MTKNRPGAPTSPAAAERRETRRYWGAVEPPKAKSEFFNAVTAVSGEEEATVATIRMYGPIDSWGGWWGISTEDVGRVLDALPTSVNEIVLRINSPGGEVWEAMAILNMLGAHRARVIAVVDGLAASAASFIAASCDETVMSPGSQMMVHSPWSFAAGNSVEMRKTADFLDKLQESMIEVYTGKAGEQDWGALLAEETWLSASDTVELGLADRVAIVPDAGTSSTVGDEPEVLVVTVDPEDDEDAEARSARVLVAAASARAAAPKPPRSSEPGDPIREEDVVAYDDLKDGLRDRLGVTDTEATDEELLEALDEALNEQTDESADSSTSVTAPAGTTLIDSGVLARLQSDAQAGRSALDEQTRQRREGILAKAMQEGRIAPSSRASWFASLEQNEDTAKALIDSLPKNTSLPVTELGHADGELSADDAIYAAAWGAESEAKR